MSQRSSRTESGVGLSRPLDTLFFLLPFILFYSVVALGVGLDSAEAAPSRIVAFELLESFFRLFGTTGAMLPGLAVVIVLLATHLVARHPWRFHGRAVLAMYGEAALWALPLLVINRATNMTATAWAPESWLEVLALCVGAGIYEELLFRLVLISLVVMIAADLLRFPTTATTVAAIFVGAIAFALHHHPPFGGEPFDAYRFTFRTVAGIYLGVLFVYRGYGPATGAHIAYNVLALVIV